MNYLEEIAKFNKKKEMAWPGSVEIHYFIYFTICWDVFRAFDTSIADFRNISVDEEQDTVKIQKD